MLHYSHLPPESYVFEVKASTGNDNWNGVSAKLPFAIEPFFWRIRWLQVLVGVGSVLVVILATYQIARARQRRKFSVRRQQHIRLRERERIASEIHNDLGANLTRISMLRDTIITDPELSTDIGLLVDNNAECAKKVLFRWTRSFVP